MIYHVSKNGSDKNSGSKEMPFLTIQKAADIAIAGDRVVVHEGEYREWVKPRHGGSGDACRIIYEAAEGEHVVVKGSECVSNWKHVEGNVWCVKLSNDLFENDNPYAKAIWGDWLIDPQKYTVHQGDVYLNGVSLFEAESLDALENPVKRIYSPNCTWGNRKEAILYPERTLYQWFCKVDDNNTTIYANFGTYNPNEELVEINVRQSCFYPERTGLNYITVRGFEMAHAATPWAPPTAEQPGMIGPNWSKGWVIEDNVLHDSKCCAVSLGKEETTGNNKFTKYRKKPGYQNQMEAVFRARNIGWGRERIGSHIVRNNLIYDCGQTGIVGHLGCIFSEIYGNEIYNIAKKHEFWGHEIAGIKLHAAIDVQIHHNRIHHCSLGTWLDWQAQGTRVSCNVYDHNDRDLMIEVTHGPYLVDNNIFASAYNFENAAQGGAYVHNLCCGFMNNWRVMDRSTPYHLPHSTEVLGTAVVYGGDDRWYQNIFVGGDEEGKQYGMAGYDNSPVSMDEYVESYLKQDGGDVGTYARLKQPVYIDGNSYLNGAKRFNREENFFTDTCAPEVKVITEGKETYLEMILPEPMFDIQSKLRCTENLGMPRITEAQYENPDGSPIIINVDLLGKEMSDVPLAGPLQEIKAGKNKICIWRRKI